MNMIKMIDDLNLLEIINTRTHIHTLFYIQLESSSSFFNNFYEIFIRKKAQ